MRETKRSLFIVAPDANAATLKKLRGIGVATGTSIVAVQSLSDLETPPPSLSTLLIPDYLLEQGYATNGWHQVFEISQAPSIRSSGDRNIIASKTPLGAGHDWIQITNQFVRHFVETKTSCRWYSIQKSCAFTSQQIATEMTNWMTQHQIKKTSRLSALLKSLDALDQVASYENLNNRLRTMDVMLDTKHFEIKLTIPCPIPFDLDRLQNSFSSLDTSLLIFTKTDDSILVEIQLPINVSNESSFVVFITNQQSHSVAARPEKEAS